MANRKEIEDRILQIISYIDHEEKIKPLIGNLKLFSLVELLQLKEFLETGDYKPIYLLLDNKIKEYLKIIEEIKQIKIGKKKNIIQKKEQEEKQKENILLEKMLIF